MRRLGIYTLAIALVSNAITASAAWSPTDYRETSTLEFLTVKADGNPHWSTVWLVVLDGDVYIRLGARAASRIESNTKAPFISVRIGGEEFSQVEAVSTPEMADAVAQAMAEKYWSDVFVRWIPHPLTMRLQSPVAPAPPE
jgi:hypothetical protein